LPYSPVTAASEEGIEVRNRSLWSPSAGTPSTRAQVWQAVGASLLVTGLWRVLSPLAAQPLCCDAAQYLQLAADPSQPVPRPYSNRVLVPWLVHVSGGDPVAVYHVISLLCLAATGLLLYLLTRRIGATHWAAMVAMVALLSSRGWVFYLYDPYLSDPAAFLLLTWVLLVLVRGRPMWLLATLLALMAAARELFAGVALALYAWLARRPFDLGAGLRTSRLIAPGVVVYLAVSQLTPGAPSELGSHSVSGWLAFVVGGRIEQDGPLWFTSAFTMSLGLWWVLGVAAWRDPAIRRLAWWLLPVFALVPFGYDWSRFLLYAFPVVVPAGALPCSIWLPDTRRSIDQDHRLSGPCCS
jgi:hypothetical protein